MVIVNKYDEAIAGLRAYAHDKRRSEEYRLLFSMAADALAEANRELKECRELIERFNVARVALMTVCAEIANYGKESEDDREPD